MKSSADIQDFLRAHCARYPKLELQDIFKALYQSAFGCEHLIADPSAAADYIRRLRPYARLDMVEVAISSKEAATPGAEIRAMEAEGAAILEKLKRHPGPVIVLDRTGDACRSDP